MLGDADPPAEASALNQQVIALYQQGRYAEAEPPCKRALAIREKALGPDHPDVAASLNNLATLYRAQGRSAEAEPPFKRALAIREKALGPDHPDVTTSLNTWSCSTWTRVAPPKPCRPSNVPWRSTRVPKSWKTGHSSRIARLFTWVRHQSLSHRARHQPALRSLWAR